MTPANCSNFSLMFLPTQATLYFSHFPRHATFFPLSPPLHLSCPLPRVAPFILLLPGESSYSSLKDQLTCHLLLEAFPSSFFPGSNPSCGSSSCLSLLWLLSLIAVIVPDCLPHKAGRGQKLGMTHLWVPGLPSLGWGSGAK